MKSLILRRDVLLAVHTGSLVVSTHTLPQVADQHSYQTGSLLHRSRSKFETSNWDRKVIAKPQTSPRSRPRVQRRRNDNYCLLNVARVKDSTCIYQVPVLCTCIYIPIHSQSRKYMHFHIQGRSYQFKVLPFGLSTVPMEFTVVANEVKLMALQRGIRIHQYLDDWLVRTTSHQTCLQHTQTLVNI